MSTFPMSGGQTSGRRPSPLPALKPKPISGRVGTALPSKPGGGLHPSIQTLPNLNVGPQDGPPPIMTLPQRANTPQPPGPAIIPLNQSPSEKATNEVAGIAERLRGLPTMQSERIAAESRARANVLAERDRINAGLMNRNAGAYAGRAEPMAAAGRTPGGTLGGGLPQAIALNGPPRTPAPTQAAQKSSDAYAAARMEGTSRTASAADRILAERGDTNGKSQIARVGNNAMMIKTPDGKVNVVGLRNKQLMSEAAQTGQFPQAQANAIRAKSEADRNSSDWFKGRRQAMAAANQSAKDTRALRAAKLYGLPGSTPAVAAAAGRLGVGKPVLGIGSMASVPKSYNEARQRLEKLDQDPFFSEFGVKPTRAKPADLVRMVLNPKFPTDSQIDNANVTEAIAAAAGGIGFKPDVDQKQILDAFVKGGPAAAREAKAKIDRENAELIRRGSIVLPSHKF